VLKKKKNEKADRQSPLTAVTDISSLSSVPQSLEKQKNKEQHTSVHLRYRELCMDLHSRHWRKLRANQQNSLKAQFSSTFECDKGTRRR